MEEYSSSLLIGLSITSLWLIKYILYLIPLITIIGYISNTFDVVQLFESDTDIKPFYMPA